MSAKIVVNLQGFWLVIAGRKAGGTAEQFAAAVSEAFCESDNAARRDIVEAIKAADTLGGMFGVAAIVATECVYRQSAAKAVGNYGGYVNVGAQVFVTGRPCTSWDDRQINYVWSKGYVGRVLLGTTARSEGYRAKKWAQNYATERTALRNFLLNSKVHELAVFCDAFSEATGRQAKDDDFEFFATASAFSDAA